MLHRKNRSLNTKIIAVVALGTFFIAGRSAAQTCGSTNHAAGRPVTATASASYEAGDKLVDGNDGTHFWPSDRNTDQWTYVQLASSVTICRVVIKWVNYHQGAFKVQVTNSNPSGGGVTWTDIATVTNNNNATVVGNVAINDISIANSYGTNQYVRLLLLAPLGNVQPTEIEVYSSTVSNNPPTVSIASPAANATFTQGANITINANAADNDGTISKVEFYQGSTKLGEDLTNPYSYTWNNVATGNYALTARAYDNGSASTTSSAINIAVNPPPSSGSVWSLNGNAGVASVNQFLGTTDAEPLIFTTNNLERARIDPDGVFLIGTTVSPVPSSANYKLAVSGGIKAKKVTVTTISWPDFVFEKGYKLPTLKQVETFIQQYGHLPGVPSEAHIMKNGLEIGAGQAVLLQKIEELTLYLLEQNKKLERQQQEIEALKKKINNK